MRATHLQKKNYRTRNLAVIKNSLIDEEIVWQSLTKDWQDLLAFIQSSEYISALGTLCRRALGDCKVEARFLLYDSGCWVSPHTDREDKVVTQLFYFTSQWDAKWGGCLRILRSSNVEDVAYEILPTLNTSAIIVRSSSSWHAVPPVDAMADLPRQSLLVHYVKDECPA